MPLNLATELPPFRALAVGLAGGLLLSAVTRDALALDWKGYTWNVTSGGMAGVAKGSPSNVSVDSDGYLHLKITNTSGTWTASELFTTEKLGFGTYQWQVDGPIDRLDQNVVLGLFPYGPAAGIGADGTNEIDIEYSFWGHAGGDNGDWTDYPASGKTVGELSYKFSLAGGTLSTSRFIWSKESIQDFLMTGLEPVGATAGLLKTWTYSPTNPTTNIPQQALPLGINLWCFQAPPSDGKDVELVIRDFQFVAEGAVAPGAGGATGSGGTANSSGGRASGNGGTTNAGGAMNSGGTPTSNGGTPTSSGGATNSGGYPTNTGGAAAASGGATTANGGTSIASGGTSTASGGTSTANGGALQSEGGNSVAGSANEATANDGSAAGCGCRLPPSQPADGRALLWLAPLVLLRRRRARLAPS